MTAALVVVNVVALTGLTLALLRHRVPSAPEQTHRALLFLLGGTWTLAVAGILRRTGHSSADAAIMCAWATVAAAAWWAATTRIR